MAQKPALTLMISAGEPSGDRLGAALMAALKKKIPHVRFIGVGGPEMEKQGLTSHFPYTDLALMGLLEVVPSIPRIIGHLSRLQLLAETERPAALITIDSQDFSSRLAARVAHLGIPRIQYVAPKVWAWRQGRARKLSRIYTKLLSILPFEGEFFKTSGIPAPYVGHPAVEALKDMPANSMSTAFNLALLPGSRRQELKRHWPLMLATYRRLRTLHMPLTATLALTDERALAQCQALAPWEDTDGLTVVLGGDRFQALSQCRAALSKSGTNNLELALLGVPAVVCYRMNALTYFLAKRLVKVKYISLPNLIMNEVVYPEFIQNGATPENLTRALHPILLQKQAFGRQKTLLTRLKTVMATPQPPAEMAAAEILKALKIS
jgi:lipid-A-disaccharide synthase